MCGIIYRTTMSVLRVLMLFNGVLNVRILICVYNVTSLFVRTLSLLFFLSLSFRAIVGALWCILVIFHSCFYLSPYFIINCLNGINKQN